MHESAAGSGVSWRGDLPRFPARRRLAEQAGEEGDGRADAKLIGESERFPGGRQADDVDDIALLQPDGDEAGSQGRDHRGGRAAPGEQGSEVNAEQARISEG